MELREFKKEFDPLVSNFINNKILEISNDKELKFLKDSFLYLDKFISDGKRIRPFIAYLTYCSFGGKERKTILEILVFIELFHNFCLVHDDIMDNSSTRHGINTINQEFGNSQAILIGDYLYSWAWEIASRLKLDRNQSVDLYNLFSEMTSEVFLGQAIDINLDKKEKVSNDIIFKKTLLKTSGYTFIKPMQIGLLLSDNYSNSNIKLLQNLGKNLGLAFQIQDDLLDIISDFNGKKKTLGDMEEGKHTLISNYVFKNGTKTQKIELKKVFGKKIKNKDKIRNIFYESGAIDFANDLINNYYDESKKLAKSKIEFLELIELLKNRKS